MTIKTYKPEHLDKMALRFLDLASQMRTMTIMAKEENCNDIPIHDRKAIEWLDNLELWAKKTKIQLTIFLQERKKTEDIN
ncbi:MAG: hypothetical protein Q4C95_00275 [Planctomycetia bacterium]|nr:hypothetical protein [Planctomycetia bacterium]